MRSIAQILMVMSTLRRNAHEADGLPGIPKAAGTPPMKRRFQLRKIPCFLAASYILLAFVVIGIIFEEASPLLASLQLLVVPRRAFTLPVKSFTHAVILKR